MNKNVNWLSYSDLAWTELIISSPEEYRDETELYSKTIITHSTQKPKTLLHLGCGAGINDFTFKRYFKVTGVDISHGMLKIARKLNPEARYVQADMRGIRLKLLFDTVVIPDSIGYMTTVTDLRKAITTGYKHLKAGGILLIVAHVRDSFNENNFVYSGLQDAYSTINWRPGPTWSPFWWLPALFRLDYILVSSRMNISDSGIFNLPGSDHRGVFADIEILS